MAVAAHQTFGFGNGFKKQLSACWRSVPIYLKLPTGVLGFLSLVSSADAFLFWLGDLSRTMGSVLSPYYQNISPLLANLLQDFSYILIDFCFLLSLSLSIVVGYLKIPEWQRIRFRRTDTDQTISASETILSNPVLREKLHRAENLLERGKVLKAAVIFDEIGNQYAYRAGKLYQSKGKDRKAKDAFEKAGAYFGKHYQHIKAGDAYYHAENWRKAAEHYRNFHIPDGFQRDSRFEDFIRRWGESLFRLNAFLEAARIYEEHGFYKLAGEAFSKAERPEEAAQAYEKAGAFAESAKAFESMGKKEQAALVNAKRLAEKGEHTKAGAGFETAGQYRLAGEEFQQAGLLPKAAQCFFMAEDYQRAVELFLEIGQEERAVTCYQKMGYYKEAAELAGMLGLQDRQAELLIAGGIYIPAARCYLMIGEITQAVEAIRRSDVATPEEVMECRRIIDILYEQKRYREALAISYAVVENRLSDTSLVSIFDAMVSVYEGLGQEAKAAEYAIRVAYMEPDISAYQARAEALSKRTQIPFQRRKPQPAKKPAPAAQDLMPPLPELQTPQQRPINPVHPPARPRPAPPRPPLPSVAAPLPGQDAVHHTAHFHEEAKRRAENNVEITLTLDMETAGDLAGESNSLKRYQIIREIGQGGMGSVFLARDKKLDRRVALKMLNPDRNQDPKVLLFFKREAKAVAKLTHPNIVALYDLGKTKDVFYMVMEYVDGVTLDYLLRKHPKGLRRSLVGIWYQVCAGLDYAHEQGILHRDIKPANVMVTKSRNVKILDFGLAKEMDDMERTAQIWGTPTFMAPELFLGERASTASDIYALGATFYVLATGKEPHDRDNPAKKFTGDGLPIPAHEINQAISPRVSDIIQKCLHLNLGLRYNHINELMKDLKNVGK